MNFVRNTVVITQKSAQKRHWRERVLNQMQLTILLNNCDVESVWWELFNSGNFMRTKARWETHTDTWHTTEKTREETHGLADVDGSDPIPFSTTICVFENPLWHPSPDNNVYESSGEGGVSPADDFFPGGRFQCMQETIWEPRTMCVELMLQLKVYTMWGGWVIPMSYLPRKTHIPTKSDDNVANMASCPEGVNKPRVQHNTQTSGMALWNEGPAGTRWCKCRKTKKHARNESSKHRSHSLWKWYDRYFRTLFPDFVDGDRGWKTWNFTSRYFGTYVINCSSP